MQKPASQIRAEIMELERERQRLLANPRAGRWKRMRELQRRMDALQTKLKDSYSR